MASKGRTINLLDPLTVERSTYTEIRSKGATAPGIDPRTGKSKQSREGALLGNRFSDGKGSWSEGRTARPYREGQEESQLS